MKFTAVGDVLIQKNFPGKYDGFAQIQEYIGQGDFRFFNLETTLNRGEFFASQYCGGSYLRMDPAALEDIKRYGFNVVSICNNHSMDFSHDGLLNTKKEVEKHGLIQAGVGKNLSEAAAPAYVDTLWGRIALIGVTASFYAPARAGEQSRRFPGRPGINGLRHDEVYEVSKRELDELKHIAEITQMNGRNNVRRSEGYLEEVQEGYFDFKDIHFVEGNEPGRKSLLDEKDMARIEKSIYEAQMQADYIVISIHTHQMRNGVKEETDFFIEDFAHRCIDLGVHAIIGHGPHLLRGIEIYKERPIFYSLGNFILHNENIPYAPEEFYATYGLTSEATMHELFKVRSKNFTRGLQTKPEMFETIIPYWIMERGKLIHLEILPVELGFGMKKSVNGWPRIDKRNDILEHMQRLSEKYGTHIEMVDGKGIIKL